MRKYLQINNIEKFYIDTKLIKTKNKAIFLLT